MIRRLACLLSLTLAAPILLHAPAAEAAELDKKQIKALVKETEAAYKGKTLWALRDLPVHTGMTMGFPWVGPIAEVTPGGWKVEATQMASATMASTQTTYFGVRPYDTVTLKEVEYIDDKEELIITFIGTGDSKGRDTKIRCTDMSTYGDLKPVLDELLVDADPAADWPAEIQQAVQNRALVNGMTKRQAYLVTGEPASASTEETDGKKVEIWRPRENNGMKIGMTMALEGTGFPEEIRFEDGKLVGVATGSGGGVSLD